MASSRSSVIQFSDSQDAQSELKFQEFSHGDASGVATLSPSESFTTFPDSSDPNVETEDLLGEEKKQSSSFWEFSYYQSFFDVDTDQVVQRILWSMVPLPGRSTFLDRQIRPKPDLYGPFWITATLIFSTAICANIASYLGSEGQKPWSYDFHKVSLAATALYSYAFIWPILIYGLMWYRQKTNGCTLLEILCVYGYSLAIYVPISVLWVIQVAWIQWILVIVGAALSGTVLVQTFWPIFKEESKKIAALVLCLILLMHTLLAVGFVMYFFRPSYEVVPVTVAPVTAAPVSLPPTPASVKLASLPSTVEDSSPLAHKVSRNAEIEKLVNSTRKKDLSNIPNHNGMEGEKNDSVKDVFEKTVSKDAIVSNDLPPGVVK